MSGIELSTGLSFATNVVKAGLFRSAPRSAARACWRRTD
jgi:hypothetical protein